MYAILSNSVKLQNTDSRRSSINNGLGKVGSIYNNYYVKLRVFYAGIGWGLCAIRRFLISWRGVCQRPGVCPKTLPYSGAAE